MKRVWATLSALALTALLWPVHASADDFGSRGGPMLGFGLGVARSDCDQVDCASAGTGSLDLHVGMQLSPRLALTADIWGIADSGDEASVRHGILTVGPKVWLLPSIWAQAGLGVARAHIEPVNVDFQSRTSYDPALVAAAGWEFWTIDDYAFDLQVRGGQNVLSNGEDRVRVVGAGIGFNWY